VPSPSRPSIVVLGGANTDYLIRGPELPEPGQTLEGDLFLSSAGGKGANQAVAAARLGAEVAFLARLGSEDRADELLAQLRVEGVITRHVARDAKQPTGAALVMVDGQGRKQILAAPGANLHVSGLDVQSAGRVVAEARVLSCVLEVPTDAIERASRLARKAGVKVLLDPAPARPLGEELLGMIDLIKPNAHEAETLTGLPVKDRDSAGAAGRRLLEMGVGAAVVSAPSGVLLVSGEGEEWVPHFEVDVVDETGAGDALAAALAVILSQDGSLFEELPFAVAVSALATTGFGAQAALPARRTVEEFLRSHSSGG